MQAKYRRDKTHALGNNPTASSNGRNRMKTMQGRLRAVLLLGAAVSVLAFTAGAKAQNRGSDDNHWSDDDHGSNGNSAPHDNPWPYSTHRSPVLAVVGDIACQPG